MPKCDYCHKEILETGKLLLRLINYDYEFCDKHYHIKCLLKAFEDKGYLSKLEVEYLFEIL